VSAKSTVPLDVVADDTDESSSLLENLPALTGIIWARQWQVYHVANLAEMALHEAEGLLGALSKFASKSAFARPGKKESEALDMAEVSVVISEVLDCIDLAAEYLAKLNTDALTHM